MKKKGTAMQIIRPKATLFGGPSSGDDTHHARPKRTMLSAAAAVAHEQLPPHKVQAIMDATADLHALDSMPVQRFVELFTL